MAAKRKASNDASSSPKKRLASEETKFDHSRVAEKYGIVQRVCAQIPCIFNSKHAMQTDFQPVPVSLGLMKRIIGVLSTGDVE